MEHPESLTARPRASHVPWQAWVLGAVTVVALVAGTVARGFIGDAWIFTTNNLGESVPSALPILVGTGVAVGADRWPVGRAWLVAGAWLLAVAGVLSIISDVQFTQVVNQGGLGFQDLESWFLIFGVAGGVAHLVGFGALAIGIWRSRPEGWPGVRAAAAVALATVTAVAAAGPLAAIAAFGAYGSLPSTIVNLTLAAISTLAVGGLAVAAVRGGPPRGSIPELVISTGAATFVAAEGLTWWLFVISQMEVQRLGSLEPLGNVALVLLGTGFASGAVFRPVDARAAQGEP